MSAGTYPGSQTPRTNKISNEPLLPEFNISQYTHPWHFFGPHSPAGLSPGGWTPTVLPGKLETHNLRPMGKGGCVWLPTGTGDGTIPGEDLQANLADRGGREAGKKEGSRASGAEARPVHQPNLPCSKEGWLPEASGQFEAIESLHDEAKARTVQDLIRKNDWLVSIDLKDAYLSVPVCKDHRKFLRFVWKHVLLPIPVPTIRLEQCSKGLHKATEASDGPSQEARGDIPGRYATDGKVKTGTGATGAGGSDSPINWEESQLTPTKRIIYLGFLRG